MKASGCGWVAILASIVSCAPYVTGVGLDGGSGGDTGSTGAGVMMGVGDGGTCGDAGDTGCSCAADQVCDSGGRCLTVLAKGQSAGAMALGGTTLYWTVNSGNDPWSGSVMKCAAAGCDQQPTTLATAQSNPSAIAADGTDVYWVNSVAGSVVDGSLMKCAASGCSQTPATVLAGGIGAGGVIVDATDLYWTTWGPSLNEDSGSVWRCPLGACTPTKVADVGSYVNVLAASATTLLGAFAGAGEGVWVCSPGACAPTMLTSTDGTAAMDSVNTYFLDGSSLSSCALGGCGGAPTTLVSGLEGTGSLATDGVSVYFVSIHMDQTYGVVGKVLKCAVGGCGGVPTTVASLPCASSPGALVLDATYVYWIDEAAQMVLKAPK